MRQRKVVVAMPFGKTKAEKRKAILNFERLKYIIENKCQVVPIGPHPPGTRIAYDVEVAKTATDQIPDRALSQIVNADILIALLSERNLNVVYELGYRRARQRTVILMVDSQDDVPIYEASVAYQSWRQDDVLGHIDLIAGRNFPQLDDFKVNIPGELRDVIDALDNELIQNLEEALQEVENNFIVLTPDPVQKLRSLLSDDEITRFYPFSVVEVGFSKRGEFEDSEAPTKVVEFDEKFSRLYGYVSKSDAYNDGPLTLPRLLNRLEQFSDPEDWETFLQEQKKLTDTVIKDLGFALATVPIKINGSHTDDGFKCKSFLPCIAARVVDGNRSGPHRMYLLIVYVELPNGTAHLPTRGEE